MRSCSFSFSFHLFSLSSVYMQSSLKVSGTVLFYFVLLLFIYFSKCNLVSFFFPLYFSRITTLRYSEQFFA